MLSLRFACFARYSFVQAAKVDSSAAATASASASSASQLKKFVDLKPVFDKTGMYCLNEDDDNNHLNMLNNDPGMLLKSDADEQLLIHIPFTTTVKVHSINMVAPPGDTAPATVRIFVNKTNPGFDDCEAGATQTLQMTPKDLEPGSITKLNFVKFQAVTSLTVFVEDNQGGDDETILQQLSIYGIPLQQMDMSEFKQCG